MPPKDADVAGSEDPEQAATRAEQSDRGLHCYSICVFWSYYPMVKPVSLSM